MGYGQGIWLNTKIIKKVVEHRIKCKKNNFISIILKIGDVRFLTTTVWNIFKSVYKMFENEYE